MAFKMNDLSVLAYANGFTLWHYRTADPGATVAGAGYFAAAADLVRTGDMMLTATDGGSTGTIYHVGASGGTDVTVAAI